MTDNMRTVYARITESVIAAIIAVAALAPTNIQTTLAQQKGSPAADSIAVQFYLRPHENPYFSNMGIYQVSTWSMGASKGSTICPLGDCKYSIENPQFISNNNFTRGHTYLFTGLLNVSATTNGTTNSKFYPMLAQLDKTASQEKAGQTTESLQGTIQFGGDLIRCYGCRPEFEYKVDNGTLFVNPNTPVLTLQGTVLEEVNASMTR
jgi:hypothetical protein